MKSWPTALFFLTLLPTICPAAQDFDLQKARQLFEARCSQCHSLDRPLKKNKDRAGWERTVGRMKGYAGGTISEADAATIVEYLVRVRGPAG